MNRRITTLAILPLLALGACSTNSDDNTDDNTPTISSTTPAPTTAKTHEKKTPTNAATSTTQEAAPVTTSAVTHPHVVECLFGTPGPSQMSDGTIQYTEYCANQPGAQEILDAEANAGLPAPNTTGCDGPAAICGYGVDENGNRNPTSGEIQTVDGCEKGYITDPELCAAARSAVG